MKKIRLYLRSILILSSFMMAASSAQALSPAWPSQHQGQFQFQFQFQVQGQSQGHYHPTRPKGYWHYHNGKKHFHYYGTKHKKPKKVRSRRITSKNNFEDFLHRRGYRHIHRVRFTGTQYVAKAINRRGHKVKVRFDCYTGRKISETILVRNVYR